MQNTTERDPLVMEVRAGLSRLGLTHQDLADHLRISRQAIGKRLKLDGPRIPFPHTEVVKVAAFLGVTVTDLYEAKSPATAKADS